MSYGRTWWSPPSPTSSSEITVRLATVTGWFCLLLHWATNSLGFVAAGLVMR